MANNWNIDPAHSDIHFVVRHMVFAKVRGRFGTWSAQLRLDDQDLTRSSVKVELDAASIDTGNPDRDNHLRSADFLAAESFPKLAFESSRVEKVGGENYRVHGKLTIRDVTREVALDVELGGRGKDPWGNERVGFTAHIAINREDFGLTWNQVLEAGGVLVGDKVDIEVNVQAVQGG